MKKILVLAMTAILAVGTITPILAANGYENGYDNGYYYNYENGYDDYNGYENGYENGNGYDPYAQATPVLLPVGKVGYITYYADNQLTVRSVKDDEDIIVLNLSEETIIVDAVTGLPASIADRETDRVKAYHAIFTTMSMPPQSPALVIAINLPEDNYSPSYHIIEAVKEYNGDTLLLTVQNGERTIRLNRETTITPHLTRQYIAPEHLKVGDGLLFWYAYAGGEVTADKVIFLHSVPQAEYKAEYVENGYEYDYPTEKYTEPSYSTVESTKNIAEPGTGVMRNGIEFFPVRKLAESAGFNVAWDAAISSAVLTYNTTVVTVANNATTYYVNGAPNTLPAAVIIVDGVMYAPHIFFYAIA